MSELKGTIKKKPAPCQVVIAIFAFHRVMDYQSDLLQEEGGETNSHSSTSPAA